MDRQKINRRQYGPFLRSMGRTALCGGRPVVQILWLALATMVQRQTVWGVSTSEIRREVEAILALDPTGRQQWASRHPSCGRTGSQTHRTHRLRSPAHERRTPRPRRPPVMARDENGKCGPRPRLEETNARDEGRFGWARGGDCELDQEDGHTVHPKDDHGRIQCSS